MSVIPGSAGLDKGKRVERKWCVPQQTLSTERHFRRGAIILKPSALHMPVSTLGQGPGHGAGVARRGSRFGWEKEGKSFAREAPRRLAGPPVPLTRGSDLGWRDTPQARRPRDHRRAQGGHTASAVVVRRRTTPAGSASGIPFGRSACGAFHTGPRTVPRARGPSSTTDTSRIECEGRRAPRGSWESVHGTAALGRCAAAEGL